MTRKIVLLAPGGEIDSIKAAIAAGANAVYCGLNKFNARNRATNITFDDLNGILRLAHANDCEVFLTLNIIIVESEIRDLFRLLNKLVNTSIDGIIIQDLGLFYLISKYFESLKIHASTQLTTHNEGQIKFLSALNATRVNLSRELNINEIDSLTVIAHKNSLLTEVFVHGSYCISYSGICYMSSVHGGNSGNRGRCSQPCRDEYVTTSEGKNFPLNLKDNSAYHNLQALADAGVDSLKIEGRIKQFHYVYTVVDTYRARLRGLSGKGGPVGNPDILYKVFNRDFSSGYLEGDINHNMFIDNSRDHSSRHLAEKNGVPTDETIEKAESQLYAEKGEMRSFIRSKIDGLSAAKAPINMSISGEAGEPLKISVKTPDSTFEIFSELALGTEGQLPINHKMVLKSFKAINETEFFIERADLDNLPGNLYIPFRELTSMKNRIIFILRNSRETIEPVNLPVLKRHPIKNLNPSLFILISSEKDLHHGYNGSADIFFQLPDSLGYDISKIVDLFQQHNQINPWFPSVLIGEDFDAAVEFLRQSRPKKIVTNNTGIAYEAWNLGIPWIAGPNLNLVNSFGLLCLKENFNCTGAFLSNELNKHQIRGIKRPAEFDLYYSIFHPIELMTSRQCLFHQVTGCHKERIDNECIQSCTKSASITNLKNVTFFIDKTRGTYNRVYNENHYLNTEIASDVPDLFSGFLIDLRKIETVTKTEVDNAELIRLFEDHLEGIQEATQKLDQVIGPSTNTQYRKGI